MTPGRCLPASLTAAVFFIITPAQAQVTNAPTINGSVTITTGNTFQTALAALGVPPAARRSLTVQNNNTTTDNCWLFLGAGTPTKAASILLTPGGSYSRYYPFVPSDAVQVTCATTADTLYVDTQ